MSEFTKEQQAQHCDQLADILSKLTWKNYDHSMFLDVDEGMPKPELNHACGTVACALGWASIAGIGGLQMGMCDIPFHANCLKEDYKDWFDRTVDSANYVFGKESWENIFNADASLAVKFDEEEDDACMDDDDVRMSDHRVAQRRLLTHAAALRASK